MALNAKSIVPLIVALVILGAILSMAIEPLIGIGSTNITVDGSPTTIGAAYPTLTVMIGTLLPVLAVIGIALLFMGNKD